MLVDPQQRRRRPRGPALSPGAWALLAVAVVFAAFAALRLAAGDDRQALPPGVVEAPEQVAPGVPKGSQGERSKKAFDPLAFDPADTRELERRAAAGFAQP